MFVLNLLALKTASIYKQWVKPHNSWLRKQHDAPTSLCKILIYIYIYMCVCVRARARACVKFFRK